MYSRGQFAVIGKVGRKALRLYHEEGLLVPAYINEENGYHYYAEEQLAVLEKIRRLRSIGLSLFEIRQVLEGKADENEAVRSRIADMESVICSRSSSLSSEGSPRWAAFVRLCSNSSRVTTRPSRFFISLDGPSH